MFANIAPFKTAERARRAASLLTAEDTLYAQLTERFQGESSQIQANLQEAIRTAKSRRDYRTPLWTYNSVELALEANDPRRASLTWLIDTLEYDTRIEGNGFRVSVHRLMKKNSLLQRLGAFFGDHFTVSTQVSKVLAVCSDYTAVEHTVYLNYWVDRLPATILRNREVLTEPPSVIEIDTTAPFYRVEGGVPVWYNTQ